MRSKLSVLVTFLVAFTCSAIAQVATTMDQKPVEMADAMRSNGKIYVVVAVLLIVLAGLFLYVIRLDKKISQLEKESK